MPTPISKTLGEPDWNQLPPQFHFLIEVTRRLTVHCGQADDFHPTDEEIELMERAAQTIRDNGGFEPILDWVGEHQDFFIVGRVLMLMEMIGFQLS